jgi:DNA-binding NarL/FixJ family response regulator
MKQEISIIIADDHPLLRRGVKELIEEQEGWQVVGEASDGEKALELVKKFKDAILIIDIMMPKMNGFEVAKAMRENKLSNNIIILSMHNKESFFDHAMDLGILGYVIKDSTDTEIIDAIKNVSAGKYYLSPSISGFAIRRGQYINPGTEDVIGISKLTTAERKILKMISENMSTKEIANKLFISVHTVERHRANICQRLDLHGTNVLLRFALEHKDVL